MTIVDRLRALVAELTDDESSPESIGLFLVEQPWISDYSQTPTNARVFAVTAAEGVHFGLIEHDGSVSDDSPVVMTVPGMLDPEESNVIVGASVSEFLALGAARGFDNMNALASGPDEAREWLASASVEGHPAAARLRRELSLGDAFDLDRFEELQRRYRPLLRFAHA